MLRLADIAHETDQTATGSRHPASDARTDRAFRSRAWCGGLVCMLAFVTLPGCQSGTAACKPDAAPLTVLAAGMEDPDSCWTVLAPGACGVRFPTTLAIAQVYADETWGAEVPPVGAAQPAAPAESAARTESSAAATVCAPGETFVSDGGPGLLVEPISSADQARWVEAFRGLTCLGNLEFISPVDVKSHGNGLPGVLTAAQRVNATLLLTYSVQRSGLNTAGIAGILYAVGSGQPLARLQSHMQFFNEKGEEVSVDEQRGDHREQDAAYQAARDFESRSVACLREIAHRTPAVTTTEPHRWIPLYPYCWQPLLRPQYPPTYQPPYSPDYQAYPPAYPPAYPAYPSAYPAYPPGYGPVAPAVPDGQP